ncbi:MAG: M20/M25/M40 family metallo-hydrolase [Pseudomonadales bacterium]
MATSAHAGPAAERLAQSIRYATISQQDRSQIDYEAFRQHQKFLRATYPKVFELLDVDVIAEHSLLLIWQGSDKGQAPVLFTAHTDVVPIEPGTEHDWPHPPFAGVIADGMIYGRGTLDDKVGVISLLEAINNLLLQGYRPKRTLVFGFGHDEEISGRDGAGNIAKRLQEKGLHFDWMVDEGGFIASDNPLLPDRAVATINVTEKVYITLTLRVKGPGGHSSMPPPHTSIGKLAAALVKIESNPMPARLVSPVTDMLESLAPYMSFPKSFLFNNLWLTNSLLAYSMSKDRVTNAFVRSTTAVTMFNAGVKENVVPQQAEAKVNFRPLPGETPLQLVNYINEIIEDPEIEISYEDWANPPRVSSMEGGGYAVIEAAIKAVYTDAVVVPSMLFATTDTRHYVGLVDNIYRFHGALVQIEQASGAHGTNERIGVESFENTVAIAEHMLRLGGE